MAEFERTNDLMRQYGDYRKWKGGMKHSSVSKESPCGLINGKMLASRIGKNDNIQEVIKSGNAFKHPED
ncbi:hypothetical protein PPTG_21900 [Phytophthora nicotianae INRA-310]|uniref:Uncharacterized protein n=1 Tax=Phytophthora nicotianae (strain INRA-310) TaxID=761204 RepID=W2QVS0_PHYN3|nr:hypothetical protein PPTG_21900 [Phytophthora nicotianae INRA-310]ETN16340.1 hypothetical protein PPTG_21900 [Phytophthora nicotianae INRA-310]